jgi:hypothetical protein
MATLTMWSLNVAGFSKYYRIEWTNPAPYFFIDVKDASAKVTNWGTGHTDCSQCRSTESGCDFLRESAR